MVSFGRSICLGLFVAALGLALAGAASTQQAAQNQKPGAAKPSTQQTIAKPLSSSPKATTPKPPVVDAHPKDGGDDPAKDDKRESWIVRLFKFFDRHNGSFNAVAALAVAFFTWRLWRLSAQEVAALGQQSEDVKQSIAEAARAATAMETMAVASQNTSSSALASVELASKAFNTEYRPWIYPTVALTFPFAFDDKGIHTTLGIGLKNRGRLHALDVDARAWMFLNDGTGILHKNTNELATEFRNSRKKGGRTIGKTVFPEDMESIFQGLRIWKSEIEENPSARDDAIIPILYVLITYRSPIDDILHDTYAVYHLFEVGPQTALIINPQKGDIPPKRISILQIHTQAT